MENEKRSSLLQLILTGNPRVSGKLKFTGCLLLLNSFLFCQQEAGSALNNRKRLICADISIAEGMLLNQKISTVSVPARLEYYLDEHVSLKNDLYFHISAGMTKDLLKRILNHESFAGIAYHPSYKPFFDPYIAFQPGLAYTQVRSEEKIRASDPTPFGQIDYTPNLNPVLGLSFGFNYFFPRYFHFFIEIRYIHGTYLFNAPAAFPIDELKGQFGLGWNFDFSKKHTNL
jgi:hypothetical protein